MAEHFNGCHPEDAEDPGQVPEGYQPADIEDCWHCGRPTLLGSCNCGECFDGADYISPADVYHCLTCRRWWGYMNGLNITKITFERNK